MSIRKKFNKASAYVSKEVFGSGGATGRYGIGRGKGGLNITNIAKDLAYVKSRLNVEKKQFVVPFTTFEFGQNIGNSDGFVGVNLTPLVVQGVAENQRIGTSIKVTGLNIPLTFAGQPNTRSMRKIKVTLLQVLCSDDGVLAAEAVNRYFDTSPNTGVRDYQCPRGYRTAATDGISMIKTMTCVLPGPAGLDTTGTTTGLDELDVARQQIDFNVKLQSLLRFNDPSGSLPVGVRWYLIFQADAGNASPSVLATNPAYEIKSPLSGVRCNGYCKFWYVDN